MDKDMILQEKEAEVKCFKTLDNFSLIKKRDSFVMDQPFLLVCLTFWKIHLRNMRKLSLSYLHTYCEA